MNTLTKLVRGMIGQLKPQCLRRSASRMRQWRRAPWRKPSTCFVYLPDWEP